MPFDTAQNVLANETVDEAIRRNIISITDQRVTYRLNQQRTYDWTDPEEWIRAHTIAWLVIERDYPTNRIKTEVVVPRRTPHDFADVVVYSDDQYRVPYLVVENKAAGQSTTRPIDWSERSGDRAAFRKRQFTPCTPRSLRRGRPFVVLRRRRISIDRTNRKSTRRKTRAAAAVW